MPEPASPPQWIQLPRWPLRNCVARYGNRRGHPIKSPRYPRSLLPLAEAAVENIVGAYIGLSPVALILGTVEAARNNESTDIIVAFAGDSSISEI
jgi:hypothetical protein